MSWDCRLSKEAEKDFRRLPRDRQDQLRRAIDEMGRNPFSGDVLPIKGGHFEGALRKRSGRYGIIFKVESDHRVVEIAAILIRSEKTYR